MSLSENRLPQQVRFHHHFPINIGSWGSLSTILRHTFRPHLAPHARGGGGTADGACGITSAADRTGALEPALPSWAAHRAAGPRRVLGSQPLEVVAPSTRPATAADQLGMGHSATRNGSNGQWSLQALRTSDYPWIFSDQQSFRVLQGLLSKIILNPWTPDLSLPKNSPNPIPMGITVPLRSHSYWHP